MGGLDRIRRRIAAHRAARAERETDADTGIGAEDDAPDLLDGDDGHEAGAEPGPDQLSFEDSGYEPASLGDLHESRRESLGRRLRGLRRRPPLVKRPDLGSAGRRLRAPLAAVGGVLGTAAGTISAGFDQVRLVVGDLWFRMPLALRQRLAAAAALLAVLAFGFFVLVPLAPCWVPGGDRCPPGDEAVDLVSADVAAYLHLNVDTDTDQYEAAQKVAGRLPDLSTAAVALLTPLAGRRIDYEEQVRPWSDGELALVVDSAGLEISRMLMFEVADAEAATEFSRELLGPGLSTTEVAGVSVESDRAGLSAALYDGFLLLGPEALVRETIELQPGDTLGAAPPAQQAADALPDDSLLTAYLSPEFAATIDRRGTFAGIDTFVNSAASEGVAAALSTDGESLDLAIRSVQDPERSEAAPDFFSALPLYEPELTDQVSGDALVYLGVGDPGESAATLVGQAAETAPDVFRGLKDFNRRLRKGGGVSIEDDLLPLLEGEAALTVEPERSPDQDDQTDPGLVPDTGVPYLALLATGVDAEAAVADLAHLQGPISKAVDPASGQAPAFQAREIAGLEAQSLRLSPVVDLTYATFDDELIIGTNPAAVERVRADDSRLADARSYEEATKDFPGQVSMLLYLDLRDLLNLGERLFLAEDPGYLRLASDLRTLEAAAAAITRTRTELATDVRVTVGERETPAPGTPEAGQPELEIDGG